MGDKSHIEWTDATWNPITGCDKVSQGCKFCYAERLFPKTYPGRTFTDVRFHEDRLDMPIHWRKPRRVFVNSMSDLFHELVTSEQIAKIIWAMGCAKQHIFQVLTKRPERMLEELSKYGVNKSPLREWAPSEWPFPHIWWGVSVEDQKTADERIPLLLQTPAAVRWVSYEPALGPVDFSKYLPKFDVLTGGWKLQSMKHLLEDTLDWVVAGGESGPKARQSELAWYRSVRDKCSATGVPFFMKQLGNFPESYQKEPWPFEQLYERPKTSQENYPTGIWALSGRGAHGEPEEWPEDLRVREYPMVLEGAR